MLTLCVQGLPIVTICNLNPVRLSAFTSSDLYNAGQMYGILTAGLELVTSLADSNDLKAKVNFSDEDKREPFDLEEFQKRAGHQFEEVLKYCNYGGKTCFSSDFKPVSCLFQCFHFIKGPKYFDDEPQKRSKIDHD